MPDLLVDIGDSSSGTAPVVASGYANVPGLVSASVTVDGTASILMIVATVEMILQADTVSTFRLTVDGSQVGPYAQTFQDATDEGTGLCSLTWFETGLSAGTHTFGIQWRESIAASAPSALDTGAEHSLQVLEILDNDTVNVLADITLTTGAWTSTDTSADVTNLTSGSVSVDSTSSVILMTGTVPMTLAAQDDVNHFRMSDGGTEEGGEVSCFQDGLDRGVGLASLKHMKTGISGSHTFSLEGVSVASKHNTYDVGEVKAFNVLEFVAAAAAAGAPSLIMAPYQSAPGG